MDIDENAVVSNLIGGLGNNLFIAVAGWILSQRLNCKHYIFQYNSNDHNWKRQSYNETILKYLGEAIPVSQSQGLAYCYHIGYTRTPCKNAFEFDMDSYRPKMILDGYFQNYSYIQPYETDIRSRVLQGIEQIRDKIRTIYQFVDWETTQFLHIRRGDYLKYPEYHPVQPIEYYETALKHMTDATDRFIFSDDMEWVKEQPFFKSLTNVTFIDNADELYCLAFMSLCQGGAVCGNSTFSWWGAFLGSYAARSPICIPKNYMNREKVGDFTKIFPEDWIQL